MKLSIQAGRVPSYPNQCCQNQSFLWRSRWLIALLVITFAPMTYVLGGTAVTSSNAYWSGALNGAWNTDIEPGDATNWRTDATGSVDTNQVPGAMTDVYFTQNTGAINLNTTLGSDFSIKGLIFTGAGTTAGSSSVVIGGTNTLTIGTDGVTVQAGSAAQSVSSKVALGADQTWTNNSANPLTVSGQISGAFALTKSGTGTVTLSGSGDSTSAITVTAGTLAISGSANTQKFSVDGAVANAPAVTLSTGGVLVSANSYVGITGSGNFAQSGGSDSASGHIYLGYVAGASGSYTMSGGLVTSAGLNVGYFGTGSFLQTGGTNADSAVVMGQGSASRGTYTLAGGALDTTAITGGSGTSVFNFNGGALQAIGSNAAFMNGLTTANVQAGGAIINSDGYNITIAQSLTHDSTPGAPAIDGGLTKNTLGTLTLSGSNSYTGNTVVNAGTLAISGRINAPASKFNVDGTIANSPVATLSGSGNLQSANMYVGIIGTGTFNQSGGTDAVGSHLYLGYLAGSGGSYNQSGGLLTMSGLYLGYNGGGSFAQTGGTNADVTIAVGQNAGSTGTYVLGGGVLDTTKISGGAGSSVFDFNGGTLQAIGASTSFISSLGTVNVQSGGAIINSNGYNVTIPQPLLHDTTAGAPAIDGGLTKNGLGTLTLSGSETYTGNTVVNAGTLAITAQFNTPNSKFNVDGTVANAATATLSGAGSVTTGTMYVGIIGAGTFNQSGGTVTLAGSPHPSLYLGYLAGSVGTYNLSGGVTKAETEYVGYNSGVGHFVQTGGTNNSNIAFGSNGGTYALDGGVLATTGVGGAGTVYFDGGILETASGISVSQRVLEDNPVSYVQTGGAIINSNGNFTEITTPLDHDPTPGAPALDGGLTKIGAGMLFLVPLANTFTGPLNVQDGQVQLYGGGAPNTSAVSISKGATLFSSGTINAAATVTDAGTFSGIGSVGAVNVKSGANFQAGGDPGTLTENGNLLLTDSTSVFSMIIERTSDQSDLTMDAGNVTLNGATLSLTLGQYYATQADGFIYILINGQPAGSTITGEFAEGTSITAPNGDLFDLAYGVNSTDTGPGNDVLLISQGGPAPASAESEKPPVDFTAAPVPEPGAWAMLAAGAAMLGVWRSKRRSHQD